jgi:hypothetical protein
MNEELRQYLLNSLAKDLDKVTEADLDGLRKLIQRLRLSESDVGYAVRMELFVRIHRALAVTTQTYGYLRSLCEQYERSPRFVETSPGNRCFVRLAAVRASLAASLDSTLSRADRDVELRRATSEMRSAKKLFQMYAVDELRDDFARIEGLYNGIVAGDVTTAVRCDIPLVLPIPDGEYEVRVGEGIARVKIAYRPPTTPKFGLTVEKTGVSFPVELGNPLEWLELSAAEHGTRVESLTSTRVSVGFTSVVVFLPTFIDAYIAPRKGEPYDPRQPLNPLITQRFPDVITRTTLVLNQVIDQVRWHTGRFDLDRILPADIEAVAAVTLVGDIPFMVLPLLTGGGPFKVSVNTTNTPIWLEAFKARLREGAEVPTEDLLLLDAQRFLMQGELRLAVLNTNAAFELFVNSHATERVRGTAAEAEMEEFLKGSSLFENCRAELVRLAGTGDKSAGNAADLIPTPVVEEQFRKKPSVFQMVVKMHQHLPFGMSRTKLMALVHRIRGKRNEVAHGQAGDGDLEPTAVYSSIESLRSFIESAKLTFTHRASGEAESSREQP